MARDDSNGGDFSDNSSQPDPTPPPVTPPPYTPPVDPFGYGGPIPTNPGGQQIGSGTPWGTGPNSQPTGAPPGYTWDPNMAMFVPTPGTAGTGPAGVQPAGGQLTDPGYANQLVYWAGQQAGVNPSVKNDSNYWLDKLTSGAFGNDQAYAVQRMMQAEGPPAGSNNSGAPPSPPQMQQGTYSPAGSNFNFTYQAQPSQYAPPPGVSQELYNMLLQRAQQGTAVSATDPNIKAQMDPAQAQIERSRRNYLADTAEQRGPLANIQGESRVTAEKAGQATSQLQASLIGNEIKARRDEIQNALTSLGTQLNADQQRALQDQLGQMNAALQKYGIDTSAGLQQQQINSNNDQFSNMFDLNSTNQANYWDSVRKGLL